MLLRLLLLKLPPNFLKGYGEQGINFLQLKPFFAMSDVAPQFLYRSTNMLHGAAFSIPASGDRSHKTNAPCRLWLLAQSAQNAACAPWAWAFQVMAQLASGILIASCAAKARI